MLSPLEGYENKLQVYKHIFLYAEKLYKFLSFWKELRYLHVKIAFHKWLEQVVVKFFGQWYISVRE